MSNFQRLVYASRATFPSIREGSGVEIEVARILSQSRRNNPRSGLVGALYYADGCFFQCLEGTAASLDEVYARITCDPRHTDLKLLRRESIPALQYADWAMKYAADGAQVQALLARTGRRDFDPYSFDDATITDMLQVLRLGPDAKPAEALALEGAAERPTSSSDPRALLALVTAGVALAVSVVALAVALAG